MNRLAGYALVFIGALAYGQNPPPTGAQVLKRSFDYVNNKILEMAQDFPAEKYNYKFKPEMRTFGGVVVHIAAGNTDAGKAGKGEKVRWDGQEQDAARFRTRAELLGMCKKSSDAPE